jgi:hypothetical protein
MVEIVPVKQKTKRFNPDEIRATEISLGKRDKFSSLRPLCLFFIAGCRSPFAVSHFSPPPRPIFPFVSTPLRSALYPMPYALCPLLRRSALSNPHPGTLTPYLVARNPQPAPRNPIYQSGLWKIDRTSCDGGYSVFFGVSMPPQSVLFSISSLRLAGIKS